MAEDAFTEDEVEIMMGEIYQDDYFAKMVIKTISLSTYKVQTETIRGFELLCRVKILC